LNGTALEKPNHLEFLTLNQNVHHAVLARAFSSFPLSRVYFARYEVLGWLYIATATLPGSIFSDFEHSSLLKKRGPTFSLALALQQHHRLTIFG
jgi:hypothetical protein